MDGAAAGIAILNRFCLSSAPKVDDTSKYALLTPLIPEHVRIVIWNHTPKAIKNTEADFAVGNTTKANGVHVEEGMGPKILIKGYTQ